MNVSVVEGEVLIQGSVSGTDTTPLGLYAPTNAARVYLENPLQITGSVITFVNQSIGVNSINTITGTISMVGVGSSAVLTQNSTITISGAPVHAVVGTPSNTIVISGTNYVQVSGSVTISNGIGYLVDATRGNKSLSVSRQNFPFSTNGGVDNTFLDAGSAQGTDVGWVVPRNGTITSYTAYYPTGTATKTFEVRKNNSAVTLSIINLSLATVFVDNAVNIDVNQGDRLQVFATAAGGTATDPTFMIEMAWRL